MSIEKRQHSRLIVNWPVVVNIPEGLLEGEVKDISVGGVVSCAQSNQIMRNTLIFFSSPPKIDPFQQLAKKFGEIHLTLVMKRYSEWASNSSTYHPKIENTLLL